MTKSINEQYLESRKYLLERDITPYMVLFSPAGLVEARRERYENFGMANGLLPSTYCGLPYGVDSEQQVPIKVVGPAPAWRFSPLTDAQLSDIIMEQVNIRKNDRLPVSNLLSHLADMVSEHGRFE